MLTVTSYIFIYLFLYQKYKMNDAQGTGQTFADACDEGNEMSL